MGPVFVCGDSMLDVTHRSSVPYRLDQETNSVPVLPRVDPTATDDRTTRSAGGAANVAVNLAALGVETVLYSAVGDDAAGFALAGLLKDAGVALVRTPTYGGGTTTKTRYYVAGRLVGRVDADHDSGPIPAAPFGTTEPRAVILTDYGRGGVDRTTVAAWRDAYPDAVVYGDPKVGRMSVWLSSWVDVMSVNSAELDSFGTYRSDLAAAFHLSQAVRCATVVLKKGPDGSLLFRTELSDTIVKIPPVVPREVVPSIDVQGAGDTYLAALAAARVRGAETPDACLYASAAAGVAVHKPGTAVVTVDEVRSALRSSVCGRREVVSFDQAVTLAARLRSLGFTVGYTNGCFDLRLTAGHRYVLSRSAGMCDLLFVGVDSDERVKTLKGVARPFIPQSDRVATVADVSGVGAAFVFDRSPEDVVRALKPDVLFKGGSYTKDSMPEAPVLESYGGRFVNVGSIECPSTTQTIASLRS